VTVWVAKSLLFTGVSGWDNLTKRGAGNCGDRCHQALRSGYGKQRNRTYSMLSIFTVAAATVAVSGAAGGAVVTSRRMEKRRAGELRLLFTVAAIQKIWPS
jgi:hypothetical protein